MSIYCSVDGPTNSRSIGETPCRQGRFHNFRLWERGFRWRHGAAIRPRLDWLMVLILFLCVSRSGKMTTCTKYIFYHQKKGWKPFSVWADTFKAGAFDHDSFNNIIHSHHHLLRRVFDFKSITLCVDTGGNELALLWECWNPSQIWVYFFGSTLFFGSEIGERLCVDSGFVTWTTMVGDHSCLSHRGCKNAYAIVMRQHMHRRCWWWCEPSWKAISVRKDLPL